MSQRKDVGAASAASNSEKSIPDEDANGAAKSAPKNIFIPPRWGDTPPPPPVSWVVDGLFQRQTVNAIVGDPGVGKTRMAAHVAASSVTGQEFLNRSTRKTAVVFVNFDDSEILPRLWVRRALKARGYSLEYDKLPIYYFRPSKSNAERGAGLEDQSVQEELRGWLIGAIADFGDDFDILIIVDTFASAFSSTEANSGLEVGKAYAILHKLVQEFESLTVIVIDHTPKPKDGQRHSASASGSHQKKAKVRTEHILSAEDQRSEEEMRIRWKATKMNAAQKPAPFSVRFALDEDADTDTLEPVAPPRDSGKPKHDAAHEFMLGQLQQHAGKAIPQKNLVQAATSTLAISERTVKDALKDLQGHPQVEVGPSPLQGPGGPQALTWVEAMSEDVVEASDTLGNTIDAAPAASIDAHQGQDWTN